MFKQIKHYFIPHPETHQKAKLLSWHFLAIYILLFILLRVGIDLVTIYQPGVLGINANLSVERIINGTNQERQKANLPALTYNGALSEAARQKAQNMFKENYWAHFSPSGRDPWGFMVNAGYRFSYAGENLARNFSTSEDVIRAWMDSPSHRENIINSKYTDIGIAVEEGVLQGQKTTLVVQMFGRPVEAMTMNPQVDSGGQKAEVNIQEIEKSQPVLVAGANKQPVNQAIINPDTLIKIGGMIIVALISFLLALDFLVLRRRQVFRISSSHIAHLGFLALAGATLFLNKAGEIL